MSDIGNRSTVYDVRNSSTVNYIRNRTAVKNSIGPERKHARDKATEYNTLTSFHLAFLPWPRTL